MYSHRSRRAVVVEGLEARQFLSTSWYVSPSGSNSNPGTLLKPFQTIQAAANVAHGGDHVEIETGTYHEMVTPVNSGTPGNPIVFEDYKGEKVTVTGADRITGWTKYSGDIYKAPMAWDLNTGNNEIFVDGTALVDARWPNTSYSDPSHPATATMTSVTVTSPGNAIIYNSGLNQPAGFWQGALLHMDPGQAWEDQTAWVTSSTPGSVTISYQDNGAFYVPTKGNKFSIMGKLKSLDAPGEFYHDPTTNTLYAWMPASDSPTLHDVEAKNRVYAFNVSTVTDITIQGVSVFSSTIRTTTASNDIIVNRVYAKYVSQGLYQPVGVWVDPTDGIFMRGNNCTVENSTVAFSSGDGIVMAGLNAVVHNNVVHDVDYTGVACAGIRLLGNNAKVDHNTVYNSGRHGIAALSVGDVITYNIVHDVGLQTTEAGGIYTVNIKPVGGVVEHNQIYNIHTGGYGGTALFLDDTSSGWTVDHNTTSNVDYGLKFRFSPATTTWSSITRLTPQS